MARIDPATLYTALRQNIPAKPAELAGYACTVALYYYTHTYTTVHTPPPPPQRLLHSAALTMYLHCENASDNRQVPDTTNAAGQSLIINLI